MLSTLTMEETQDVELARLILSAADKVGNKEYNRADWLLSYCDRSASNTGNPVQRVVRRTVRENRVGDGDEGEDDEEARGQHVQVVPTTTGHLQLLPPPSLPPNQMAQAFLRNHKTLFDIQKNCRMRRSIFRYASNTRV